MELSILKLNIILIFVFGLLFTMYFLFIFFLPFLFSLWILLIGLTVILPYLLIVIPSSWYYSAYIRNFSYKISGENILINHGVFTKIKATIPYSRIQNINIVNGVFDRMYNLSTVKIETAGSSSAAASAQSGVIRPEGYIPGLKEPYIIEAKI